MFTEAYLEPSQNIFNQAFFTSVKPYFKNVLNSIKLPLGSIFYTTHFREKTYNCENFGRKISLLTIEQYFFFSKFEIKQWNGIINKGFLN